MIMIKNMSLKVIKENNNNMTSNKDLIRKISLESSKICGDELETYIKFIYHLFKENLFLN